MLEKYDGGVTDMKVLIIEDDAEVIDTVSLFLELRWPSIEIIVAQNGESLDIAKNEPLDLIIMELNLSGTDGFKLLKKIRLLSFVPVIILSKTTREDDRIMALERGADDYITIPFRPRNLIARVNAVIRRAHPHYNSNNKTLVAG